MLLLLRRHLTADDDGEIIDTEFSTQNYGQGTNYRNAEAAEKYGDGCCCCSVGVEILVVLLQCQ